MVKYGFGMNLPMDKSYIEVTLPWNATEYSTEGSGWKGSGFIAFYSIINLFLHDTLLSLPSFNYSLLFL